MTESPATRASERPWTPALVRWALEALPEWLEDADRSELDASRRRWDGAVLARIGREAGRDRVHAIELLARTDWHPEFQARAGELRVRFLAETTPEEVLDLGRLALESGHLRIVEQEELAPPARARALAAEYRVVEEIAAKTRALVTGTRLPGSMPDAARSLSHRLGRLGRRLHDQADEAALSARLERVFGVRPVAWFSRLTFSLLVVLLVLLIADAFVPWESSFKQALRWIDTGICAVFLWEFFWRLAFAPRRARWFLRHFLTDFVPALPFALLLDTPAAGRRDAAGLWVRLVRFLRVPMYARYVRFLKPIVAFFRLLVFWVRGMDRLVQGMGPFLNRNIVMFEPEARERVPVTSFRDLGVEHDVTTEFERLAPAMRKQRAPELRAELERQIELALAAPSPELLEGPGRRASGVHTRVMRAEDLVHNLQSLEAEDVADALAPESVRSLGRLLALADIPPLRWLPVIGSTARAGHAATPADRIAHAGRALGDHCQRALGFVVGWADLSGVLTPTQILDRIATALMKSTQRPAVRLLLFGSFFVLVKLLFEALPWARSDGVVRFLDRFVATPLLVLGAVCLVLLLVARWLKRLAGEASERLLRSSEARFVNLLELRRRAHEERDRAAVVDRLAAMRLRESRPMHLDLTVAMEELRGRVPSRDRATAAGRRLALLVLDYQDGAFLHRSDTKLAEQFLAHPDLWCLRHEHLGISRHEARRLAKLDLESGGLFSGPYLWFDLVTHALAVKVARLCASYNLHLIPLHERDAADPDQLARHQALVQGKGNLRAEPAPWLPYRSSRFHVLHFFDPDPRWEAEIETEFGADVVARLRADRTRIVREVFGTRPLHRLPEDQRSFNPLELYQQKLGGGRILLLPLALLRGWLKLTWMLVRMAARSAREILDPRIRPDTAADEDVSFDVARRKIRRLKKPLLFACVHLAARVDPEYLGLDSDGGERVEPGAWEADLALCEPAPAEVARIRRARRTAAGRLLYLPEFLETAGQRQPGATVRRRLACAFAMDERGIARLAAAESRARAWLYEKDPSTEPPGGLPVVRKDQIAKVAAAGFKHLLAYLGTVSRRERKRLEHAWRADQGDFRLVCQAFGEAGARRPIAVATELAERLLADPEPFLSRLETLHVLLALCVQDLQHYGELVFGLGAYGESAPAPDPVTPPVETSRA